MTMTAPVSAAPIGDESGALLAVGEDGGAACYLGWDSAGPALYANFGRGIVSLAVGTPAIGVSSWLLTMHPDVLLGVVTLSMGHTTSVGYTNPYFQAQFKIIDFGPGHTANPVTIEVYVIDSTGALVDPAAVMANTGYLSFTMGRAGTRQEETLI